MEDEDYDADIYEEKSSKVVYKRKSSTSRPRLLHHWGRRPSKRSFVPTDEESIREFARHSHRRASWTDMPARDYPSLKRPSSYPAVRRETSYYYYDDDTSDDEFGSGQRDEFNSRQRDEFIVGGRGEFDSRKRRAFSFRDWRETLDDSMSRASREDSEVTRSRVDEGLKRWSENARRVLKDTPRKSWPLRPEEIMDPRSRRRSSAGDKPYYNVTKWEVDYNNKNYIRSQCHKPIGLHRFTLGRTFDWDVDYDNSYYIRSKVNVPRGLHRRQETIRRKRVPDRDILADSRGWEFEYGPEFYQVEEDVPYMPQERTVTRGAYRWYGVRRNDSDTDTKMERTQKQEEVDGLIKDEFKYGGEFEQDDVEHIVQAKDRRIGRGAYRFYDAQRSKCDERCSEDDMEDDEKSIEEAKARKAMRFKRTVLKKTLTYPKPIPKKAGFGTEISFVPGEDEEEFEGTSQTLPSLKKKRHRSIRSAFKQRKPRGDPEERGSVQEEGFNARDFWKKHKQKSKKSYPMHSPVFKGIPEEEDLMEDSEKDDLNVSDTQPRRRSTAVRDEDYMPTEDISPRRRSTAVKEDYRRTDDILPRRRSTAVRGEDYMPTEDISPRRRSTAVKDYRTTDDILPRRRSTAVKEDYRTTDDFLPRRRSTAVKEDYRATDDFLPRRRSTAVKGEDYGTTDETQPRRRSTAVRETDDLNSRRHSTSTRKQSDRASIFQKARESLRNEDWSPRRSSVKPPEGIEDQPQGSYSDEEDQVYTSEAVWGPPGGNESPGRISPSESVSNDQIYSSTATWGKVENELKQEDRNYTTESPRQISKNHNKKFNKKEPWKKAIQTKAINSKWDEMFSEDEEDREQQGNVKRIIDLQQDESDAVEKLPPHVGKRIRSLRNRMLKTDASERDKHPKFPRNWNKDVQKLHHGDFDIDLRKHRHHPNDYGQQGKHGYEKYASENGSEIWEQAEESFTELHHRH